MRRILTTLILALTLFSFSLAAELRALPITAHTQTAGNPDVRVWVNTNSGVYHCPGTRWYGTTKQGEYMTQRQAQQRGYRPAYRNPCA